MDPSQMKKRLDEVVLNAIDNKDVRTIDELLRTGEIDVNYTIEENLFDTPRPWMISHDPHRRQKLQANGFYGNGVKAFSILIRAIKMLHTEMVSKIINTAAYLGQTMQLQGALYEAFSLLEEHHNCTTYECNYILKISRKRRRRVPPKYAVECKKSCKEIIDILIGVFQRSDPTEQINAAFVERNFHRRNAFLHACHHGTDNFVMICLDLIKDCMQPPCNIDWFWERGDFVNVFQHFWCLRNDETRLAMIERVPRAMELVNSPQKGSVLSLYILLSTSLDSEKLAKFIMRALADIDMVFDETNGNTALLLAISNWNISLVHLFLRAGCKIDIYNNNGYSPLAIACEKYSLPNLTDQKKKTMAQIIEMLLALGVNLQKELYLYDVNKLPDEFQSDRYAKRREAGRDINAKLLERLKKLQGSYLMLSLQCQCRKVIRQMWKSNADEMIECSLFIAPKLKPFLKMENEPNWIFDLETGELLENAFWE